MRKMITIVLGVMVMSASAYAQSAGSPHKMQHGFVLSNEDSLASHLVASGHHSRQAEIIGQLVIDDPEERMAYHARKAMNGGRNSYFLFQAQDLNLPSVRAGQTLSGHIVESALGRYEPKNVIVKRATFRIDRVMLNLENPFFVNP